MHQLHEVDRAAVQRMDILLPQMMTEAGLTEELKNADPLQWAGAMNAITAQIEEILLAELEMCIRDRDRVGGQGHPRQAPVCAGLQEGAEGERDRRPGDGQGGEREPGGEPGAVSYTHLHASLSDGCGLSGNGIQCLLHAFVLSAKPSGPRAVSMFDYSTAAHG